MALSERDLQRLSTCHPDLQRLIKEVGKSEPMMVIFGYRGQEEQDLAYAKKNSPFKFPQSKHNKQPSLAVDIAPLPLNWSDTESFIRLARMVKLKAKILGIDIIWGGDFKKLKDLVHFELNIKG